MVATDLQPVSIVEDEGFLHYSSVLDPRYQLPSRRTIERSLIPKQYTKLKTMVKEKLVCKTASVAVTTDIWSSRQQQSYCCLTAHSISSEIWELENHVLETFNFTSNHTSINIAHELTRIVDEWRLPSISCCVTDNASNMLGGIKEAGWRNIPCFAHTLNLIVQDAIRDDPLMSQLQQKCKDIVSHFHRSPKSSEKLRSVQEQLSIPSQVT